MALENILSQEIVQKLGWTLLHFVWQAATVALLLGILLAFLRKSSANLRYIIACAALGLIVLLPIVTIQLVPVSTPQPIANIEPAPAPVIMSAQELREIPAVEMSIPEGPVQHENTGTAYNAPWKQRAAELLEPALPYIVSAWLLGVFGLSLWHLGGWAQLQRLRKKLVRQVDESLYAKLRRLSERLRVKRAVQLAESALVQVPTVVGWMRPVILLPASALTGLSSEQLEALLAHELAHIRRHDYLINMLQTLVETLGFYHPAVWWVSHKIRLERENCCDDLAVSISGDRVRYARALTSMEEIRGRHGGLAVAAAGGNLFGRIRRLVGNDSTDSSRASWIPSVITILLIAIIAVPTSIALTTHGKLKDQKTSIESNQVVLKLVGPDSQPVVGAWVGTYVDWSDIAESPPIWFLNDGGSYKASEIESAAKVISNEEGKITLTEEELFKPQWPTERTVPLTAIDDGHYLAGLRDLSREDLGKEVTLTLQPGCRVHGRLNADAARKRKWSIKTLTVYVDWDVHRPCQYSSEQGRFEFVLPPGKYNVKVYSEDPDKAITLPILIRPGQRDLDLTKYLDGTSLPPAAETESAVESDEGRIEGRIIDINTGRGISSVQLAAVPNSSPELSDRFVCTSAEDGTFAIGGLQSGEYLLQGDFPSVDVDVVSGRSTKDVLIGVCRGETVPTPKETTAEQQGDVQILIGMRVIEMPADAMKDVFEPNEGLSSGLLVRHGHEIAGRLLTLTQEQKDAKLMAAPQVIMLNNQDATIAFIKEEPFIHHYEPIEDEPGKFAPQIKYLEAGWKFKIHAKILDSGEKVHIELATRQQEPGFETRQYRPGYDYQIPIRPEIFVTEVTAKNGEPVVIIRLRLGEPTFCFIVTPSALVPEPLPEPLLGKKLPEPENIQNIDDLKQAEGKPTLICFWDMNQRPSRNLIAELAEQEKELAEKNVAVLLVHTSKVEPAKLKEWLDSCKIPFACGNIEGDAKKVLFRWGVRAQPWLILTGQEGVVSAEGFNIEQLDEKLQTKNSDLSLEEERSRDNLLAKSAAPSAEDKSIVRVDLSVVEVSPDPKMDTETIITIRNLLAGKITVPDSPAVADLLRKAAEATAAVKDESAGDKRVTQKQFDTLFDTLVSRGYVKILMNPTLEVFNGGTAKVMSRQKVPIDRITMRSTQSNDLETKTEYEDVIDSIEITPNVLEDGNIILQVNLDLSLESAERGNEQTPITNKLDISTQIRLSPGESGIISGMKQAGLLTEPDKATKDSEVPATEMLVILTPTIVETAGNQQNEEMVTRVYHIYDLVLVGARISRGIVDGMVGGSGGMGGQVNIPDQAIVNEAQNIVNLIMQTIDPNSWYENDPNAKGIISPFPAARPRKLAIYQILPVHQQIEKLLKSLRRERTDITQISIEMRYLYTNVEFLDEVRDSMDIEFKSDTFLDA